MCHFNHKNLNYGINGSRILGICLLGAGLIVLFVPVFFEVDKEAQKIGLVGGGAILLGAVLTTMQSGTQLDFQSNRFREYQSIGWFTFGDWQELPKVEHAEMIIHSFRSQNIPNGITPTMSGEVTLYKCVVLADGSKFLVFDYSKEKDAVEALEEIKDGVGI